MWDCLLWGCETLPSVSSCLLWDPAFCPGFCETILLRGTGGRETLQSVKPWVCFYEILPSVRPAFCETLLCFICETLPSFIYETLPSVICVGRCFLSYVRPFLPSSMRPCHLSYVWGPAFFHMWDPSFLHLWDPAIRHMCGALLSFICETVPSFIWETLPSVRPCFLSSMKPCHVFYLWDPAFFHMNPPSVTSCVCPFHVFLLFFWYMSISCCFHYFPSFPMFSHILNMFFSPHLGFTPKLFSDISIIINYYHIS